MFRSIELQFQSGLVSNVLPVSS